MLNKLKKRHTSVGGAFVAPFRKLIAIHEHNKFCGNDRIYLRISVSFKNSEIARCDAFGNVITVFFNITGGICRLSVCSEQESGRKHKDKHRRSGGNRINRSTGFFLCLGTFGDYCLLLSFGECNILNRRLDFFKIQLSRLLFV